VTGPPIEISIDELTLHGLDPRHGGVFVDALRTELAAALTGWRPATPGGSVRERLDLGELAIPRGAAPAQVGRAVGAGIARALRESHARPTPGTATS
jgi:hypothetical protein